MKVLNKVRDHPIANVKLQFLEILGLTLYCQHQLQNVNMFHPQIFMPWRRSITSALAASNESAQLSLTNLRNSKLTSVYCIQLWLLAIKYSILPLDDHPLNINIQLWLLVM